MWLRARQALGAPVDNASLAWFRIAFGLLLSISSLRFMAMGWIDRFYGERTFFFHYWGLDWLTPWPVWGMYLHYGVLVLLGLCVAAGYHYRLSTLLLLVGFAYAEFLDVTNYLNHYYLVTLLLGMLCVVPTHHRWSLDARRRPSLGRSYTPAWGLYLLRFQVALVYFYAAMAKVGSDWLVHGQPLNLWLSARSHLPSIGPYLGDPTVALVFAWAGFLNDLLVPPLVMWKRTRPYAYAVLVVFHVGTHLLFNIGIFPVLMPLAATLFFDPGWPTRLWVRLAGWGARPPTPMVPSASPLAGATLAALAVFVLVQILVPLRAHLYEGDVLWHEQGMRWSWRVMVRSKRGAIQYRVRLPSGRELRVPPRRYLTGEQEREMSGQPDLILQLGRHIARDFRQRGHGAVQVFVDAPVSLNGRRPALMIDPRADLASIEDGLAPASWILPAPVGPPARLKPAPLARLP